MQKRERLLAGAIALLVGGWLLDSVVVQPSLAWFAAVDKDTRAARREIGEAKVLIDRQGRILGDWRSRHAAGLIDDEDQARFRMQRTLQNAAQTSGFAIASVGGGQLIPAAQEQAYDLLRLTVSGHGTLDQVQRFVATLESASMPLKLERSELSSGDSRKDGLDAAFTLSTRLVSATARAGRAVAEGTIAWTPEKRSDDLDHAILEAKPFLSDRKRTIARTAAEAKDDTAIAPPAKPVNPAGWALVGIVAGDHEAVAFLRHQGDGSERLLKTGEQLDDHTVLGVDQHGLRLRTGDNELLIAVGQDLKGQALDGTALPTAHRSTSTAGTSGTTSSGATGAGGTGASPFQVPTITADPAREAILQRLRSQRNRAP
ncbi:MAG TPA: hypothetical protein VHX44_00740 [Planctomycetota bacterium]|nr:hypothetical protein [Planctomycetota bacterium]